MTTVLTETRLDDGDFDLDVRLQAVTRHTSESAALKPTDAGCPDGPTNISCHPEGGCFE
jgi:hypothetical protein